MTTYGVMRQPPTGTSPYGIAKPSSAVAYALRTTSTLVRVACGSPEASNAFARSRSLRSWLAIRCCPSAERSMSCERSSALAPVSRPSDVAVSGSSRRRLLPMSSSNARASASVFVDAAVDDGRPVLGYTRTSAAAWRCTRVWRWPRDESTRNPTMRPHTTLEHLENQSPAPAGGAIISAASQCCGRSGSFSDSACWRPPSWQPWTSSARQLRPRGSAFSRGGRCCPTSASILSDRVRLHGYPPSVSDLFHAGRLLRGCGHLLRTEA